MIIRFIIISFGTWKGLKHVEDLFSHKKCLIKISAKFSFRKSVKYVETVTKGSWQSDILLEVTNMEGERGLSRGPADYYLYYRYVSPSPPSPPPPLGWGCDIWQEYMTSGHSGFICSSLLTLSKYCQVFRVNNFQYPPPIQGTAWRSHRFCNLIQLILKIGWSK